jgi:hypothetical protein
MDQYGLVYVGFGGSGYAYLSFANSGAQPPATSAPNQTATITTAEDDVGSLTVVGNDALINDATPTLRGSLSAQLLSDQALVVYRDGQKIGQISPTTTSWSYTDPGAADGKHSYTALVVNTAGQTGTASSPFTLSIDTAAPLQRANVLSAYDDAGLSTGALANGSTTDDTSPLMRGSISSALATGESLIVFRDGVRIGQANVSNGEWSFADANVTAGKHSYVARVEDAAGNIGLQSDPFVLTVEVLRTVNGTDGSDTLIGSTGSDRISGVPEQEPRSARERLMS